MSRHDDTPISAFHEMAAEHWTSWLGHPVTRAFMQYLTDRIGMYRDLSADLVENGAMQDPSTSQAQELYGRIGELRLLLQDGRQSIQAFYDERAQRAAPYSDPYEAEEQE